jgi:hypothetical protein
MAPSAKVALAFLAPELGLWLLLLWHGEEPRKNRDDNGDASKSGDTKPANQRYWTAFMIGMTGLWVYFGASQDLFVPILLLFWALFYLQLSIFFILSSEGKKIIQARNHYDKYAGDRRQKPVHGIRPRKKDRCSHTSVPLTGDFLRSAKLRRRPAHSLNHSFLG